ncbi:ACP S-malonyltransferase [Thermoleophilia bacterium SCSIO 60948]|nr:ACP S-malonyltransferase [Thermoleophilia bacterium SCSIO 60948]
MRDSAQDRTAAVVFPGQGSHADGMEAELRGRDDLSSALERLGFDPFERLGEGTRFQQPAVFLCSVCDWRRTGPEEPIAAAGHSLGEYSALVAAGALSLADGVELVAERGAAMADAGEAAAGSMVAMLGGDADAVEALATELGLTLANDNAPGQLVLSGPLEAIDAAVEQARERTGAKARKLDVSGAFHSPLMEPAAERLAAALENVRFDEPRFPVVSCATARPFEDPARELVENLLRPVRWQDTVRALRELGAESFHEPAPGRVLTGTIKRILPRERSSA